MKCAVKLRKETEKILKKALRKMGVKCNDLLVIYTLLHPKFKLGDTVLIPKESLGKVNGIKRTQKEGSKLRSAIRSIILKEELEFNEKMKEKWNERKKIEDLNYYGRFYVRSWKKNIKK